MLDRIIRAIRLDPRLYREAAETEAYTTEAFLIVLVTALLSAVGTAVGASRPLVAFFTQAINSILVGWVAWAFVAYVVGALFGGQSTVNELLRALGYAAAPRFLGLLGFIPCVGWVFIFAAWLISLAAGIVAIREAMEFDTMKALITAGIGWAISVVFAVAFGLIFGGLAALGRAAF
jgi:hypothetical protein